MDGFKYLERQQQAKNTLRQYSVELGLRTHRPSALTPDLYLAKTASRSTVSTSSMLPQFGDTEDWWKVPSKSRPNYEQKTRPVQISYSAKEIYGKAQLDHPHKNCKQKRSTSAATNSTKIDINQNSWKLWSELDEPHPSRQTIQSSATDDFANFNGHDDRRTSRPTRITAWEPDSSAEAHLPWVPHDINLEDIKFRTFEEAMRVYPSSDSEVSDIEANGRRRSSLKYSDSDESLVKLRTAVTNTTVESTHHTDSYLSPPDEPLLETGSHDSLNSADDNARTQYSPDPEALQCDITEGSVMPRESAQEEQTVEEALQLQLEDSFNQNRIPFSASSDSDADNPIDNIDECTQPAKVLRKQPVPKIDLTELSPKKVKSPRTKKPGAVAVSKSTNFTSTKARRGLSSNVTKSVNYSSNTKQIAEQIKRKVNNNPKEIVKEIKKRVQNNKSSQSTLSESMESKWKNFYLNTENIIQAVSRNRTDLQSFSGYDKYYAMSPRIEAGEMSVWNCLPDELWLHILSYLDRSDLYSFMVTSHECNRLAHDRSLWKKLVIQKKQLADDEVLKVGELRPTDLSITQCTGTKLNGDMVTNHGLMTMFKSCGNNLKTLSIASCVIPPLSGEALLHSAAIHCERVTSLDVSWCNVTDDAIILIGDSFPELMSLSMNGNQSATDVSVTYICQKLTSQLRRLELQGCFKITNDSLEAISQCTLLTGLNFGHCNKLRGSALATCARQLPDLESLNLKGLKQIRDSCITAIVRYCTKLERLDISQCTGLTPITLTEISCSLRHLKALDMGLCKGCVNDASLSCLLANCKSIQSLDLSSNPITNSSLSNLATNCTSLRDLKINFCSVTDSGVRQLLNSLSGHPHTVQLYGVKGINAQDLSSFFPSAKILS